MNYNNYPSIGIDTKIKIMQDVLFQHLGFNNVDFYGRVQKVLSKDQNGFTPEVYISNTERKEVYYDDQKAAGGNVFFVDNDEHTTTDGKLFVARVKVVFMLNLNKVASVKSYRADSEIQQKAVDLIKRLKAIEITSIEKGVDNVLSDFNVEKISSRDLNQFYVFSVNGNLNYSFDRNHESSVTTNDDISIVQPDLQYLYFNNAFFEDSNPSVQYNFADLSTQTIEQYWLDNVTKGIGLGGLFIQKTGSNISLNDQVFGANGALISFNGYFLADKSAPNNGVGSYNGNPIAYRRNPNRTTSSAGFFQFLATEPCIVKIENSIIVEIINLPITGFSYQ